LERQASTFQMQLSSLEKERNELEERIVRLSAIPGSITSKSPAIDPADDPAWEIVRFALNTKYEDLSPKVVEYTKQLILDTLGIAVGRSSAETIPGLIELVKKWGGKQESTILVHGGKVPAPNAAIVLGPMTRSLDLGDTHPDAAHLSEHIVPVLLATIGLGDAVVSPSARTDKRGPTAVLKSVSKIPYTYAYLLNQKFLPQFLEGENKEKFAQYLRAWCELGIGHIQFNVIDKATLIDAQAHPENYTNLVVRVAGYSAYFIDLPKALQDDVINRVEQGFR
jgi:hypothetical protein